MSRWSLNLMADARQNTNISGRNHFTWETFDALPYALRQVIAFAPVKLGTRRAYEALQAGTPLQAVIRQEVVLSRRFVREHVLLSYGPTHPQAAEFHAA